MHRPLTPSAATVMSGGEAIVEALVENGVDTVFGLPGAQLYPLFDGLHARRDRIRTVGARHEQGCGYMAFGRRPCDSLGLQRACAVHHRRGSPGLPSPPARSPA